MTATSVLRAATLCLSIVAAACADGPAAPALEGYVDLANPWTRAAPESVDMDGAALAAVAERAAEMDRLRSLLVVRRGRMVLEEYHGDVAGGTPLDVRSVTKSVVSLLTGIALERGDLPGLDAPVRDLLPPGSPDLPSGAATLTVRHLLSMTSGFAWDESAPDGLALYDAWARSTDPVRFLLDRGMSDAPGSRYVYNSAAVHLLGRILETAAGTSLPAYAQSTLFGPLGIAAVEWEAMSDGTSNGGSGLDLRARDLARIGQLVLQRGWSGGRAVVPAAWVEEATERYFPWTIDTTALDDVSYGYLWWTDTARDAVFAWGFGGQFIYVAPALELVVVATTEWWDSAEVGGPGTLAAAAMRLIVDGIVPAAR